MTLTQSQSFDPHVADWLEEFNLKPPATEHPDWGFKLSFSTVPVFDWTLRRSKVGAQELWFGVGLSRTIGWKACLFPRDEAFKITWRSDGVPDVQAQSLVHRHRTPWPSMSSLSAFPEAITAIETLLGRHFLRSAEFSGPSLKTSDFSVLSAWLRPVCDEIEFTLGTVHGDLPSCAEVEDNRKEKSGVRLKIKLTER